MTTRRISHLILTMAMAVPCLAQPRRAATNPGANVQSPEVLPDHRVMFRLYAPKATEVSVTGDWVSQGRGTGGKLEKDDQGVWSITVGPLVPDFYSYSFTVDGVRATDPRNGFVKPGKAPLSSMLELPGEEEAYEATRPVPHGEVHIAWYHSSTLDTMRSVHVYTPPAYESGSAKYPVFYLLHGSGDDDAGWSTIGRAGFILDNLLAEQKIKPMIVVMPNGSMPRTGGSESAQDKFTDELLNNVMPYVEKHYRVIAKRESRAIAGLSMGGGQTLRVGPAHVDRFAYMGVWSSGLRTEATADFEERAAAFFKNPEKTNQAVKLFWIGVGEKDQGANASAHNLAQVLEKHGIRNEFHESEGAHTWINWRHYLHDYAQLLFR